MRVTEGFDLSANSLTGRIADQLYVHCPSLGRVAFHGNRFDPDLPLSVGVLRGRGCEVRVDRGYVLSADTSTVRNEAVLVFVRNGAVLIFRGLELKGLIPSFPACRSLEVLDLSRNALTGWTPDSYCLRRLPAVRLCRCSLLRVSTPMCWPETEHVVPKGLIASLVHEPHRCRQKDLLRCTGGFWASSFPFFVL